VTAALRVEGLTASYGRIDVVHDVSFSVEDGEAVGLVGANGAGKTTTLRAISGVVSRQADVLEHVGDDISRLRPHAIARRGVAHVPEGRGILGHLTVKENLLLGAAGVRDREARLDGLLEVFPVLRDKLRQPGAELSGGQQQMLAIARGLMANPSLLLLDEPSLGLSPKLVEDVTALIARVRAERTMSLVLVEQNVGMAAALTDRTYVLRRGRIVREERSQDLFDDRQLLETYLG
jgi:branched-chain amino acid transport system ATP-binding protein